MACGLVGNMATVSIAMRKPEVPEMAEWSSHSSSSEEEWEVPKSWRSSLNVRMYQSQLWELKTLQAAGAPVSSRHLFLNRPFTARPRAPAYRQWVVSCMCRTGKRKARDFPDPRERCSKKLLWSGIWTTLMSLPRPWTSLRAPGESGRMIWSETICISPSLYGCQIVLKPGPALRTFSMNGGCGKQFIETRCSSCRQDSLRRVIQSPSGKKGDVGSDCLTHISKHEGLLVCTVHL